MTTTSLAARAAKSDPAVEHIRCDLCGHSVLDIDAHLVACVEHEVALFVIGRRAS